MKRYAPQNEIDPTEIESGRWAKFRGPDRAGRQWYQCEADENEAGDIEAKTPPQPQSGVFARLTTWFKGGKE